jgi:hypothetical protein
VLLITLDDLPDIWSVRQIVVWIDRSGCFMVLDTIRRHHARQCEILILFTDLRNIWHITYINLGHSVQAEHGSILIPQV